MLLSIVEDTHSRSNMYDMGKETYMTHEKRPRAGMTCEKKCIIEMYVLMKTEV